MVTFRTTGDAPEPQESSSAGPPFAVGDACLRRGERGVVVKIDHHTDPASVVVRMSDGREVNTEFTSLSPAPAPEEILWGPAVGDLCLFRGERCTAVAVTYGDAPTVTLRHANGAETVADLLDVQAYVPDAAPAAPDHGEEEIKWFGTEPVRVIAILDTETPPVVVVRPEVGDPYQVLLADLTDEPQVPEAQPQAAPQRAGRGGGYPKKEALFSLGAKVKVGSTAALKATQSTGRSALANARVATKAASGKMGRALGAFKTPSASSGAGGGGGGGTVDSPPAAPAAPADPQQREEQRAAAIAAAEARAVAAATRGGVSLSRAQQLSR